MIVEPGTPVRLSCPDNPRLHGALGRVERLEEWGAHIRTDAAATGRYRAGWEELEAVIGHPTDPQSEGYTGGCCPKCSSSKMIRNGNCELCIECGESSGCG